MASLAHDPQPLCAYIRLPAPLRSSYAICCQEALRQMDGNDGIGVCAGVSLDADNRRMAWTEFDFYDLWSNAGRLYYHRRTPHGFDQEEAAQKARYTSSDPLLWLPDIH